MMLRRLVPLLAAITSLSLTAQEAKPRPVFKAVRAQLAPIVDGDLSDAVWQNAPEMTGFTQRDPSEGQPAKLQTRVKAAYTEEAIYFAAVMEDEQRATPLLARRDSDLNNGDYIRISIDSQHDRQNGAAFVVNASNVQMDMTLYNDIYDDISWDAVWDSEAKITANGWVAEVRIPFSQLRFPARDVHVWGLNVSRWNARTRESSRLVHSPKTESGFVSRFGDLEGIEGVKPKRGFEIMPYGVARTDLQSRASNPFIQASSHRMDAGLDVKYGLTSTLTLTGTINPDFGQVEVDPAVLNLSQFETSFQEKRPFFTEGASVFNFGSGPASSRWGFNMYFPTFFYSRRIGRAPQGSIVEADHMDAPGETTILGAAKITGKVGKGWTVGVLDAVTDAEDAWYRIEKKNEVGTKTVEPMTNYLVARAMKEYGKDSRAGFMFTSVNRKLTDNLEGAMRQSAYFGGVDGYTRFRDRSWILEWLAGGSLVEGSEAAISRTQLSGARYYDRPDAEHVEYDPTRTSLTGWMSRAMLAKQKGRWRPNIQVQMLSPGLELNDLGFLPRTDAINSHALIHYLNTDPNKYTREISAWVSKYQNWNFDGDMTANGVGSNLYIQLKNYWSVYMWAGGNPDRMSDQMTRGGPLMVNPSYQFFGGGFGSDSRRRFSASIEAEQVTDGLGGTSSFISTSLTYRPTPAIRVSVSPTFSTSDERAQYVTWATDPAATATYGKRYIFATLDQRTLDVGIRTEWTMNARLSMQLFLQPFVASGDYHDYKYLARPRTVDFIPTTEQGNDDFNFRSVRGSAVARWEFRPGSSMYVVWSENRSEVVDQGDFRPRRDFGALPNAPSRDVFLVKFSYWLPI
jgi:hypothetical protein